MNRPSGPRKTAKLSESTDRQLNLYALAASAAGVGLLALTLPAEAKIVYTPANIRISSDHPALLDLNHDGIVDFVITLSHSPRGTGGLFPGGLAQQNQVAGYSPGCGRLDYNYAFAAGVRIGPKIRFLSASYKGAMAWYFQPPSLIYGPWLGVDGRYLGLRFKINGKTHYGWARLNVQRIQRVTGGVRLKAFLTGYAYETIPNKPVVTGKTKGTEDSDVEQPDASLTTPTPEPPTLGALAMGAPGLSIWRRDEPVLAVP
jgi:hypothetical protein